MSPRPQVTLPQGTVVGIRETGAYPGYIESFKGIPYALPPTGDLRFRPPAKVGKSSNIIDASRFGPRAPAQQFLVLGPELEESEDCLTVNIFRQGGQETRDELAPVAIYIHGGAFNRGNAAMHDTGTMVGWSEEPFIGVSFGYRIGSLGFLPCGLSRDEGTLNLGLKDQICLMEWVQENIQLFGGDPQNVTLFGLSAGAHSIGYHLLNYEDGKAPLFHRVIIESGAPTARALRLPDDPVHEAQFKDYLQEVKCPQDLSSTETLEYLRSLPLSVVAKAQITVFAKYNPSLRWAFQPVIDGEIIRRRPIDSWKNGQWHKVPIMTGFTTNEGSLYVNKAMNTPEEFHEFWKTLLPGLGEEGLDTIETLYPDPFKFPDSIYKEDRANVGSMYRRIEAAYAHYAYIAPARQTAHFAGDHVPVFLYHWALESDIIGGARHGDNMLYETRDPKKCAVSSSQDELSGFIHAYVTSFICTGDPNAIKGKYHERPEWTRHQSSSKKVMVFGRDNKELVGGDVGKAASLEPDNWPDAESQFWWGKVEQFS
ncbi:acetylcholinesterase precursor [Stachybotrys elegans]|uniref:Carboxylic ester hydrolase n=1 Tax=Stachybotrys elegans TaxID=80388 RepID=A0A8K0T0H9_9HYPO|nr:acetylcholinesterase precursor [Stachybotrys elegans]